AGLDSRFKVAVPVYGCGFFQDDARWRRMMTLMPEKDRPAWIENYDPSKYLPQCTIPTLWANGTNDPAFPLDIYQKSYRAVRGPRTLCVTLGMKHSHPHGWAPKEIGLFVDSVLKGGEPLACFDRHGCNGRQVWASCRTVVPLKSAALHYTTDTGDWKERKWETAPARIEGTRVEAELPTFKGLSWFVTVTDERDATVSTEHEVIEE
ncbi:MAG TPA: alpha/beta hydrolase, partial [Phycisphaerae bacterium]|nr:alpha/beta hydrolase [Phycisphaerae bacterium]